jgi:hypothetical protein
VPAAKAGEFEYVPISQIPEQELWNGSQTDGMYGAADIGGCNVCLKMLPKARETVTLAAFKSANGGKFPSKETPVPEHQIIRHPLDACPRRWIAIDIAARAGKCPLVLAAPLDPAERARRVAASKQRQGAVDR